MSLHQLPESSHTPRRSILSPGLLMAMGLALATCDRTETVESSPSPERAPTGAIVETLTNTTLETRQALTKKIYEETLGATGGDFYTRGFPADAERPTDWHIHQLDVGFGPQRGIHVVTTRQANGKTYVLNMLDADGDGGIDEAESSTSWIIQSDTGTPMMHSDKSYVINNKMMDNLAAALQQALRVLEEEKKSQTGE